MSGGQRIIQMIANKVLDNMKRILCFFTAMSVFAGSVMADEGMWMLPLLQKMNGKAMQELGCQLTPKQI